MKTNSYYFKKKLSLILSVLFLIIITYKIPFNFAPNSQTAKLDNIQSSGINLVNPIFINDTDPNYNWSKTAAENDWCSGSGSWSDPYVIQNITINGNNISNCIDVQNSNKYFTIKNCTVYNSSTGEDFAGINLDNVNNSLIFDNNCSFNYGNGIRLIYTYNNSVLDNFAKNNTEEGIYFSYSANNTVRNNTIGNNHKGIVVSNCGANIIIDNNSVYGHTGSTWPTPSSSRGIDISYSHNLTITNNNMFNNDNGIYFMDTSNITLKGNNISIGRSGTSTVLSNSNLEFVDNIISNCEYGFLLNNIQDSIVWNNTILSCDEGISINNMLNTSVYDNNLINCSSAGIKLVGNIFNITITRNNFSNCEIYVSIYFFQTSTYNITKSNLVNGKPVYFYTDKLGLIATNFSNPGQIILFNCNDTFISNLEMQGGINLILCKNNTITDNIVQANYYGIHLQYCDNNTIFNNTVFGKEYGIRIDESVNCTITKNIVENCDSYGVYLYYSYNHSVYENIVDNNWGGIKAFLSSRNNITQNSVKNNSIGIAIFGSTYINIFFNNLVNNSEDGIQLTGSNNTVFGNCIVNSGKRGILVGITAEDYLIYNNSFIGNTLNAQDNGTTNQWDNGVIGNFWDDYNGDDINLDGIGDTPYNISGLASSVDRFPQIIKFPPQIIIENPHSNKFFSYNPPEINLTIISPYNDIDSIWYSLSNETYTTDNYNFTGSIEQNIWDSLGNGTVSLKFYANNTYGLMGSSEVRVWKDIISPQIIIYNPIENQEFATDLPLYNITILEANIGSVWYTIDSGANNYTITSFTGTISQIAWDAASDGPVTIRFYARDDVGNIGTSSVIVTKIPSDLPTPQGIPGYNLIIVVGIVSVISLVLAKKRFKK